MTPPLTYPSDRPSRRVEFSGLPTIDSEAPEIPSPHWDSETDHLLSYFLSDQGAHHQQQLQHHSAARHQDFASHHASVHPTFGSSAGNSTMTDINDAAPQPRTPAIQFYYSSHHSHPHPHHGSYARQTAENIASMQGPPGQQLISSSSSSSNSLSSMAQALVSGGPVLHHQIHQQRGQQPPGRHAVPMASQQQQQQFPSSSTTNSSSSNQNQTARESPVDPSEDSPISPAAMIGVGHEQMMLPPPSRGLQSSNSAAAVAAMASQQMPPPQHHEQQQMAIQMAAAGGQHNTKGHLDFIKQLNAQIGQAKGMPQSTPSQQNMPPPPNAGMMVPPGVVSVHPPVAGYQAVYAAAGSTAMQAPMIFHKFHMAAQSAGESDEKRARRLERNRESARKSRRRKKERLATLEAQVDDLHNQIEDERKKQINAMCAILKQTRRDEFAKLNSGLATQSIPENEAQEQLGVVIGVTSVGSQTSQATVEFQYNYLKQVLLPRYQKFSLWLTLHEEKFFVAGKDEFARRDGKQVIRVSSGRVSSKQIGDELTNGWKTEKNNDKKRKEDQPDIGERNNPTCRSLDAARMWPLMCFELSISVDQEERLLQAVKRLQQMENLPHYRSQLNAATRMTSSLREAVGSQCRASGARENKSMLEVLSPTQAAKFQDWMMTNQERIQRVVNKKRAGPDKDEAWKEKSLLELCSRLDEVLRISSRQVAGVDDDQSRSN